MDFVWTSSSFRHLFVLLTPITWLLRIQQGHDTHDYMSPLAFLWPCSQPSSHLYASPVFRPESCPVDSPRRRLSQHIEVMSLSCKLHGLVTVMKRFFCLSFSFFFNLPFWLFPLFPPSFYLCEHLIISALLSGLYCDLSLWVLSRSVSPDPGFVSFCFNGASEWTANNNEVSVRFIWIGSLALAPGYESICPLGRFYTG